MKVLAYMSTIMIIIFAISSFILQFYNVEMKKGQVIFLRIMFVIFMMLIAYSSFFGYNSDLFRYNQIMNRMNDKPLRWALSNTPWKSNVIINLIFWIISQTNNNRLLSFLVTGVVFGSILFILNKEDQYNCYINVQLTFLIQLIAIIRPEFVMSGIRQNLMFAIYIIALYRDIVEKRKNLWTYVLYICACLIHSSAIYFILIRMIICLNGKIKYFIIGWTALLPTILKVLPTVGILGDIAYRLSYYSQEENYIDTRVIMVLTIWLLLIFIMWLNVNKTYKIHKNIKYDIYIKYMGFLIVITMAAFPVQELYFRSISLISYLSFPIFVEYSKNNLQKWKIFRGIIMIFALGLYSFIFAYAVNNWKFI